MSCGVWESPPSFGVRNGSDFPVRAFVYADRVRMSWADSAPDGLGNVQELHADEGFDDDNLGME